MLSPSDPPRESPTETRSSAESRSAPYYPTERSGMSRPQGSLAPERPRQSSSRATDVSGWDLRKGYG